MHYLILGGGKSPEKDVSRRSAIAVQEGLESLGHKVEYLDPSDMSVDELIMKARQSDGVFPILHGIGGEDGSIQARLTQEGLPYFGPDAVACKNTFDKVIFKKIIKANGIPTPRWNVVTSTSLLDEPLTKAPFVLKPINGGSSIDTFILREFPFEPAPLLEALSRYGTMLIEELIEGSEITVGVLGNEVLPVVEIIPPMDSEFDYENKYNGATIELCPPKNVSESIQAEAQKLALAVHATTQCRHLSRTDMLINAKGELFVIDTNTIPGLTSQSLFPKAAKAAGYDWTALVERFTKLI